MNKYSASETHFALLSVQPKRSTRLEQEINILQGTLDGMSLSESESDNLLASTSSESEEIQTKISELKMRLEDELASQEKQKQENIRRRHNYVPLAIGEW